jgi:hypothetical protein
MEMWAITNGPVGTGNFQRGAGGPTLCAILQYFVKRGRGNGRYTSLAAGTLSKEFTENDGAAACNVIEGITVG